MNTAKLAKHYELLSPDERLPLIIAAFARGDTTEATRLVNSSPMVRMQARDHFPLSSRLERLALRYVARQLDLAGQVSHGLALFADEGETPEFVRVAALLFVVNFDAWQQMCNGFSVTPDAVLRGFAGADAVADAEPRMRRLAFTADEATAWLQQQHGDAMDVPTVAAMAEAMQQALNG